MAKRTYFRKRQTPTENLTFIAMMVGFDAIFSLVSALLPFGAVFIMFLVPLTSALVASYCQKRFLIIYIFSALGIALAVSAWNIANTIFYLFPALLTGSLYGVLKRKRAPYSLNIFATAALSLGLFYFSLWFLKVVTGADMVDFLLGVVGKKDDPLAPNIFPLFGFAYSLSQMAVVHIFLQFEFTHLEDTSIPENGLFIWYPLPATVFLGSAIGCAFISAKAAYLLFGMGIYWSLYCLYSMMKVHRFWSWIILGVVIFLGYLGFAATYQLVPAGNGLSLLSLPFLGIPITSFLNYVLLRKNENQPKM